MMLHGDGSKLFVHAEPKQNNKPTSPVAHGGQGLEGQLGFACVTVDVCKGV